MKRTSSGIPKLDALMEGGFPENTVMLVSGNAGAGKTLFALNYLLEGVKKGEKCVFVSLMESKKDLLRACEGIDSLKNINDFLEKKLSIEEINLEDHATIDSFANIFKAYPKLDRIVVDNLNKLFAFARVEREYRIVLSKLFKFLREKTSSAIVLIETADGLSNSGEAFEADGIISLGFLELEEKPARILSIPKMRFTAIEPLVKHGFQITSKGLDLNKKKMI